VEFYLVGYNALIFTANQQTFRMNMSPASSGPQINQGRNQRETCSKLTTLKLEATSSSDMSLDFKWTVRHYRKVTLRDFYCQRKETV
jgi:hypothetical protein